MTLSLCPTLSGSQTPCFPLRPLLALTPAAAWPSTGAGAQGVPPSSLEWLELCFVGLIRIAVLVSWG